MHHPFPRLLLALLTLCLSSLLTPQAQAQFHITGHRNNGKIPTLADLKILKVLRGDPNLISQFQGRVVVFKTLRFSSLKSADPGNPERSNRIKFASLHKRHQENPHILCVAVIEQDPHFNSAPFIPKLASLLPQDLTFPVVEAAPPADLFDYMHHHGYIKIFNASGKLCYYGPDGPDGDKAIRLTLKPLMKK